MPVHLTSDQYGNANPRRDGMDTACGNNATTLAGHSRSLQIILSFDVEDHHLIESAAGIFIDPDLQAQYRERVGPATRWILDKLGERNILATFFILGEIARRDLRLVRTIHEAGHEVASHGWNHRRLHALNPASFKDDLRKSKDALEQAIGAPVAGYRAPTFRLVPETPWALALFV